MDKNKFREFNAFCGARGCEWAILNPILCSLIAAFIGAIVCYALGTSTETLTNSTAFLYASSALTEIGFVLAAVYIARRNSVNIKVASGIKTKTPIWTYFLAVVLGLLALGLLNPIIYCWQSLLFSLGHIPSSITIDSGWLLALALIVLAVLPALCEEFLFRGVILNGLRKYGLVVSVLVSSAFFAVMHMNLLQLPYTFLLGLLYGSVVYFTRNLWLSVIMHFINNATVLLLGLVFTGSAHALPWYEILLAFVLLLAFLILVYVLVRVLGKKFPEKIKGEQPQTPAQPLPQKTKLDKMWIVPIVLGCCSLVIAILGGFNIIS